MHHFRTSIPFAFVVIFAAGLALVAQNASATVAQGKLTASDAKAYDLLGSAVAIDGDTAIVGAPGDDYGSSMNGWEMGSAYIYVRSGETWTQQAKFTASDIEWLDTFGGSVAISGNTVVVGSYGDDHVGGSGEGSAYVFVRTGSTWEEQAKLTASDAETNDYLGSVAIDGDMIILGASRDDHDGGVDAGSAYIFVRSGVTWVEQAKLTASDAAEENLFGESVAIHGDTAIVGAYAHDHDGLVNAGAVYVFVRTGETWTEQAKLTAADAAIGNYFGNSVSMHGETVLVGAKGAQLAGGSSCGAAYVFARSGEAWTQQAKLTATDASSGDYFGHSVSLHGDSAIVGAYGDDPAGKSAAGSAYLFKRSVEAWTQHVKITSPDSAASDECARSVSISGESMIVGSRGDDHAAGTNAGSAYVFESPSSSSADITGDGVVGIDDLLALLNSWGACDEPCATACPTDLNGTCTVDIDDLLMLIAAWSA